jgi:hypothetical protein
MKRIAIAALIGLGLAGPASAHHSFAMFDSDKTVPLKGTVKEFQWVNPHTWLHIMAPDATGKIVEWKIEGRSPNVLSRRGWRKDMIKPGDKVTLMIHPMKDGTAAGAITRITLANGQELNADTPTAVDTDEEGPRR